MAETLIFFDLCIAAAAFALGWAVRGIVADEIKIEVPKQWLREEDRDGQSCP